MPFMTAAPPPSSSFHSVPQNFGLLKKLHSVLGPGGTLMSDDRYQMIFGAVTADKPFGRDVYTGMLDVWQSMYRTVAKQAWHLESCVKYIGCFKAPSQFSKPNAMTPYDPIADKFGTIYPAMFFYDASTGRLYMVCLKMIIGCMRYWEVHPSRAGQALPQMGLAGHDDEWTLI